MPSCNYYITILLLFASDVIVMTHLLIIVHKRVLAIYTNRRAINAAIGMLHERIRLIAFASAKM